MLSLIRSIAVLIVYFANSSAYADSANFSVPEDFSLHDYLIAREGFVDGKPLDHYVNEWWKWAYSMQQSKSPVLDPSGEFCGVNQSGPVWFLAGGMGTAQHHRRCEVPAQKYIFFPVINLVSYTPPEEERSCKDARLVVGKGATGFRGMSVFVNGRPVNYIERFRISSAECFNLFERVPAQFEAPSVFPSATDGYWVMLRPLPPGPNIIQFMGYHMDSSGPYAEMFQNIYYDLEVLPE